MDRALYTKLDHEEEQEPEAVQGAPSIQSTARYKRLLFGTMMILLSVAMIAAIFRHAITRTTHQALRWTDCGTTPDEARDRGCHFDILSFAWQTPECYDRETSEAFLRHNGTWSYFSTRKGDVQVPEAVAISGEQMVLVTAGYHFTHCTYMWRQLHRAYSVLGYIDEHLGNWNHTLHCQKVLLADIGGALSEINTVGRIIYPKCRKI